MEHLPFHPKNSLKTTFFLHVFKQLPGQIILIQTHCHIHATYSITLLENFWTDNDTWACAALNTDVTVACLCLYYMEKHM